MLSRLVPLTRGAVQLSAALRPALLEPSATCCCSRIFGTLRVPIVTGLGSGDDGEAPLAQQSRPSEPPDDDTAVDTDYRSAVDTDYRSPTETVWPASKHQQKFASRLQSALYRALSEEDVFREGLVRRLGFSIKEIRMAPDNLKAFILWDSILDRNEAVQQELDRRGPRLRSAVAKVLGARNVPRLEFRQDRLSRRQQQIDDVFRRLDEERAIEQQIQEANAAWQRDAEAEGSAEEESDDERIALPGLDSGELADSDSDPLAKPLG